MLEIYTVRNEEFRKKVSGINSKLLLTTLSFQKAFTFKPILFPNLRQKINSLTWCK